MAALRARLRVMKTLFVPLFLILVASSTAQADIYTWVDAQGVRHYSDSPVASGAKRANLPGLQTVDGNPDALQQLQAAADRARSKTNSAESRMPRLLSPEPEQTFRDARGIVPVSVAISGSSELRDGEQITYYLDGSPIPQSPTDDTQLSLGNVPRGTHTLSAALLYQGTEIRRTEPVTFYMKPPSAISPLNSNQNASDDGSDSPGTTTSAPPAGNVGGAPSTPKLNTNTNAARPPS